MADFASPEWIEGIAGAAQEAHVDPTLALTVEQRLAGPPETAWHFRFADGGVRVVSGRADDATIVLTSSTETAQAIHAGELSAQRAFLDGALQIGGDLRSLIANRAALAEVAALIGAAT